MKAKNLENKMLHNFPIPFKGTEKYALKDD